MLLCYALFREVIEFKNIFPLQKHRLLAREAVRKSLVLLKNGKDPKKSFLPLKKNAKRILVAGTHADDIGYQCGGWTITWHGDSGRITTGMHSLLLSTYLYKRPKRFSTRRILAGTALSLQNNLKL